MAVYPAMRGKRALVTGSAQGIGRATVEALSAQGVRIFGLDIAEQRPLEGLSAIRCDLASTRGIDEAIGQVTAAGQPLDYLVNIAGADTRYSIENGDAQAFDRLMNLNLRAYYLVIRAALPLLRAGTGKSIVNVASIHFRVVGMDSSIYNATKAGILGLTRALAEELGKRDGIRVNAISPGWVFTERQVASHFAEPAQRDRNLAYLRRMQKIDRQISPADIAQHVLFYLSDDSAASTGHNCIVDAGWLLE